MEPSSRPFGAADRRDSAKTTSKVSASWHSVHGTVFAFRNSTTCVSLHRQNTFFKITIKDSRLLSIAGLSW